MTEIGKYNRLQIVKILSFGAYLDGDVKGEILLPIKYVPANAEIDDFIDVFIYNDSEDRIIATTDKPFAQVGDFAYLMVQEATKFGAFMDWGLVKNLLVPFSEQHDGLKEGKSYIVYIYLDEKTDRIVASAKLERFLNKTPVNYSENQEVELLIRQKTDIGYNAIINNEHSGLLYDSEIFQKLYIGQKIKGYIKKVREDDKIDLSLTPTGYENIDKTTELLVNALEENNGFIALTDKSSPEEIYKHLGISKKNFKKAVGNLYKNKIINIEKDGIKLL